MRKTVLETKNFSKRDVLNSRNGVPLQDVENKTILTVTAAAIMEDEDDETKELKEIGIFATSEKIYYTTISATVIDAMYDLIDIMEEEGDVQIRLDKRQSKGNREFLTITIL